MNLWIMNTTTANHLFAYRLQERQQVFTREIKKGGQIQLSDLTQDEVDRIVNQHLKYGMVHWREAHKRKHVVGLVFSTDGPISLDEPMGTFEKNAELKDGEAAQRRVVTAAAIADNIGKELGKMSNTGDPVPPVRLEVETSELQDGRVVGSAGVIVKADPKAPETRRTLSRRAN